MTRESAEQLRYVYAVCGPFDPAVLAGLTGVAGAPVEQVEQDGLVAVVSPVPAADFAETPLRDHLEDLDWLAATARAHESVTGTLGTATSPLPLRLATVFRDDAGVRGMLDAQRQQLVAALERLRGRVEWGVKVYAVPEAAGTGGTPAGDRPKAASGRDYLRQRRDRRRTQEQSLQQAEEFAQRLHRALLPHASDARLHRLQNSELSAGPGRNVFNAAYLVEKDEAEEFAALVYRTGAGATDSGPAVELTGPWAPYSFSAPVDAGAPAAAQAGAPGEAAP
jgi:hypothetical protein